jgi:hypothetical protein
MAKTGTLIYQIKISLNEIHPPIWRRIQVPGSMRLSTLHETLQIVMGWEDYHLHYFDIHGVHYTDPASDPDGELDMEDEGLYELNQLLMKEREKFIYEYDFGDTWRHTLRVEKFLPAEKGAHYPRCIRGKRACPPEDVGGAWGYGNFLQAITNPEHPEHEENLTWIGGAFKPEAFDLQAINTMLREVIRERGAEPFGDWLAHKALFVHARTKALPDWPQALPGEHNEAAEHSPLRRDVVALLTYLRDKRVAGTQAMGNLPLKAVREISQQMVDPPPVEHHIGEHVYPIRSALEVRPLYFVHALTWVSGLATGGPSRKWGLTCTGEEFLQATPAEQVWQLFTTWWFRINWAMVSRIGFAGNAVPFHFRGEVLHHLLGLPVLARIEFETFADGVIEATGLMYAIEDQDWARQALRSLMQDLTVNPLSHLGVLNAERGPHELLGERYQRLVAIQVSPLGRALLEGIR